MKTPRFRAVILAAGLGTRLRPLTLAIPKPLLPVAGIPVLGHTLRALREAGCDAVAINLHYQGDKIASRFGADFDGMPIRYSREETIQGTLGALAPLRSFLDGSDHVLVVNGDSLARWPFPRLLRHHQRHQPRATLLVSSRARPADYGGGIGIARDGRITSFEPPPPDRGDHGAQPPQKTEEARRRVFAGAHVFSPTLLDGAAPPPSDFVDDLYQPMVDGATRLDSLESGELWFDLGTPRRYLEGVLAWAGRSGWRRSSWSSPEADIDAEASVKKSVIEAGARVGAGARIRRSLVLSDASVGPGCTVIDSVLGFSVDLPSGTVIENRLVTEARADTPPSPQASVVGGLVYDHLEGR